MKFYMAVDAETQSIPFRASGSGAASLYTSPGRARAAVSRTGYGLPRRKADYWMILEIDTDYLMEAV